jgi:regulator of sirC expression with transglutaminase-like and TPR domain
VVTANLERFAELVTRDHFSLARASFLIAQAEYPELQPDSWMTRLEGMAEVVRSRCPADAFAEQKVVALNQYLFEELGFRGNTEAYYDPRNSYLNEVLERRIGIPITLSIVYIEIGRQLGLRLHGLSFPGHFLVKLKLNRGNLILDPYTGGQPQSEPELRSRLRRALQERQAGATNLESYLTPATSRDVIARLLRNLKHIYLGAGEYDKALKVMHYMLLVVPESAEELRDRGLIYAKLDCFRAALSDLQNYLRRRPEAADAAETHEKLVELKTASSRLN